MRKCGASIANGSESPTRHPIDEERPDDARRVAAAENVEVAEGQLDVRAVGAAAAIARDAYGGGRRERVFAARDDEERRKGLVERTDEAQKLGLGY